MEKLAIEGGKPICSEPFPARSLIGDEEINAVMELLQEAKTRGTAFDRYGGTHVDAYEREFAEYHGVPFATATSAGTSAIHAAIGALRLDICQEIITPPITDPGGVAPILWNNCIPIFADVDPETFNLDPKSVAERITERTRAIIVTHLAGQPADVDPIMELARQHNIVVIEDCAQAHDAVYKGHKVGTIGHMAAFSLMSGKHHTAGGQGGMLITRDEEIFWNAKRFADRGKPFNSTQTRNLFLGNNYRMTELEAVIGRMQLRKLSSIVETRRRFVGQLTERMQDMEAVRPGKIIEGAVSSYWFMFVYVDESKLKVGKNQFAQAVATEGVPVGASYDFIMYETPWIRDRQCYGQSGCPWTCPFYGREVKYEGSCPNARKAVDTHMVVSVNECFTEREADYLSKALHKVEAAYLS